MNEAPNLFRIFVLKNVLALCSLHYRAEQTQMNNKVICIQLICLPGMIVLWRTRRTQHTQGEHTNERARDKQNKQ
jgi:ABC-type nickel/cobalt efflux system permease component RcnA